MTRRTLAFATFAAIPFVSGFCTLTSSRSSFVSVPQKNFLGHHYGKRERVVTMQLPPKGSQYLLPEDPRIKPDGLAFRDYPK